MESAPAAMVREKPVGRLLARFALPAVFSLLANSVLQIVDQVLLDKSGTGALGYSILSVTFPIVAAGNALAFLFGGGGASYAALRLGEQSAGGDRDTDGSAACSRALAVSVKALGIGGLLLALPGLLTLRPLLTVFGATDAMLPGAGVYAGILWLGLPVAALANGLSYWIRADGSPGFALGMLAAGAGLNGILDGLFLFPLRLGVAGAAAATVLAQGASAAAGLWYVRTRARHFSLTATAMPGKTPRLLRQVAALGSSGCVQQGAIVAVQLVLNRSLRTAAARAAIDAADAIGAMGIVTRINGILIALVTGIAQGAQPLLGFYQGAGKEASVRKTYGLSVGWATLASVVCWSITVFAAWPVAGLFAGGSEAFQSLTTLCLRVYLLGSVSVGFQLVSCFYFQATGRPWRACLLTVSRQLLLLIPLLLLLPARFGFSGLLYAGPAADLGAAVLAGFFIRRELRK